MTLLTFILFIILTFIILKDTKELFNYLSVIITLTGYIIYFYYYQDLIISTFFLIVFSIFNFYLIKCSNNFIKLYLSFYNFLIFFQIIKEVLKFFW